MEADIYYFIDNQLKGRETQVGSWRDIRYIAREHATVLTWNGKSVSVRIYRQKARSTIEEQQRRLHDMDESHAEKPYCMAVPVERK